VPTEIQFLASNYHYDVYKVSCGGKSYCVKYSLDEFNLSLKKENEIILSLGAHSQHNKMKFGEWINYLIMDFSTRPNLKKFGMAPLSEKKKELFQTYQNISNRAIVKTPFNEFILSFLKSISLDQFPSEALESIEAHTSLNDVRETIKSVENEIIHLCSSDILKRNDFCHGSLKPSNILFNGFDFSLIDFNESFLGNRYFDLATLMIYSGIKDQLEKEFFIAFLESQGKTFSQVEWIEYRTCYEVAIRKIFLEILSTYLKETYIFSSFRPMKIHDVVETFARSHETFFKIPAVNKHYEFIYKCILEPIIGSES
jgi:thiamine kinase-like enzyme